MEKDVGSQTNGRGFESHRARFLFCALFWVADEQGDKRTTTRTRCKKRKRERQPFSDERNGRRAEKSKTKGTRRAQRITRQNEDPRRDTPPRRIVPARGNDADCQDQTSPKTWRDAVPVWKSVLATVSSAPRRPGQPAPTTAAEATHGAPPNGMFTIRGEIKLHGPRAHRALRDRARRQLAGRPAIQLEDVPQGERHRARAGRRHGRTQARAFPLRKLTRTLA